VELEFVGVLIGLIRKLLKGKVETFMLLTMTPRQPTVNIKSVNIDLNEKSDFFQQLRVEVMQNPKGAKKLIAAISSTSTTFCSGLIFALTTLKVPATSVTIDPDLRDTILILMGLIACLAVAAALIAWMAAGVWKMYFGGSSADNWTQNILKGLIQVLSGPIIIGLLLALFTLLFGNLPAFRVIKDAILVWFQV
jgi:hypothetical protein